MGTIGAPTGLNARVKLALTALLLALALALTVFCAIQTVQAFQRFQQEHQLVVNRDVRAIRPWMTVPYIAHFYHVPESYLDQSLHITGDRTTHLLPLRDLAPRVKRPLDGLIQDIQHAILNYRKHRSYAGASFLAPQKKPAAKEPGRRPQGSLPTSTTGRRPQGSPPTPTSTPASTKTTNGQTSHFVVLVEAGTGLGGEGTLAVAFAPFSPIRSTKKCVGKRARARKETRS